MPADFLAKLCAPRPLRPLSVTGRIVDYATSPVHANPDPSASPKYPYAPLSFRDSRDRENDGRLLKAAKERVLSPLG